MEAGATSVQTWEVDRSLGGLYRLLVDGEPGFATALVDRGLPRAEQLSALAGIDWAPDYPISQVFDRTTAGTMPAPYLRDSPPPGGGSVSPFMANLPVYVDLDETLPGHMVAGHLWPRLDTDGRPILEADEEVLAEWEVMRPDGVIETANGAVGGASLDPFPSSYLRQVRAFVTSTRIIITGPLHLPAVHSDDYSLKLALVSPGLDDLRATVRQLKRRRDRRRMVWTLHLRYEWFDRVAWGTLSPPTRQKGFFRSRADDDQHQQVLRLIIAYPFGAKAAVRVKHKTETDTPLATELGPRIIEALEARVSGARTEAMEDVQTEIPGGMLLGRKDRLEMKAVRVRGGGCYSLPQGGF